MVIEDLLLKTQEYLKKYLEILMLEYEYCVTSRDGYLKCENPNGHNSLLIAHMDTYKYIIPHEIRTVDNMIYGYDKQGKRCILGGDDRCGVYLILKLLEKGFRPQILFTEDEEEGQKGAKKFIANEESYLIPIEYCIQIDRGIKDDDHNNYVDYDLHKNTPQHTKQQDFNKFIEKIGFKKHSRFGKTDIIHIAPYLKAPGVNVCCGYQNEHRPHDTTETDKYEYVDIKVVENTFEKLCKIYESTLKQNSKKTVNDLVDKILKLNKIKDEFWKGYLERRRNGMQASWYHSSGFDLRPLAIKKSLTSNPLNNEFKIIGEVLKNTELVYSDIDWGGYYDFFIDIWKKKSKNILQDSDFPKHRSEHYQNIININSLLSIEPFKIFDKQERKAINSKYFHHVWHNSIGYTKGESIFKNNEYDGFLLRLSCLGFKSITIIFFCLDDRIVKNIFDEYNIEILCVFENTAGGGGGGGLSFRSLFNTKEEAQNIQYLFTDNYTYDKTSNSLKLYQDYDFLNKDFIVSHYMKYGDIVSESKLYSKEFLPDYGMYGGGFGLARRISMK